VSCGWVSGCAWLARNKKSSSFACKNGYRNRKRPAYFSHCAHGNGESNVADRESYGVRRKLMLWDLRDLDFCRLGILEVGGLGLRA